MVEKITCSVLADPALASAEHLKHFVYGVWWMSVFEPRFLD